MSGIAAGIRLAYYEKKVLILEKHAIPGGLNSYYSKDGKRFDVGLHAMTNFVPPRTKGAPLTKLLKQLKIRYDELDLVEQDHSTIDFPDVTLKFGNGLSHIKEDIAEHFPQEIDNFIKLVEHIHAYDEVSLSADYISARETVASFIKDELLLDMLFCPLMYYGSAVEDDMDFSQYCIMFKSVFSEGFCRPQAGVRHIIRILKKKFLANGGELKFRAGVKQILTKGQEAYAVELEDGTILETDKILSSAGSKETYRMLEESKKFEETIRAGALSFVESIIMLDKTPKELGINQTISFFNHTDKFLYKSPVNTGVDYNSGVVCIPNNFCFNDKPLSEGMIRFTNLASYDYWKKLSPEDYLKEKEAFVDEQLKHFAHGEALRKHITYVDAFTPLTVEKFTSHINGAIYGAPDKVKDGRTEYQNVFITGTDQGFLGIVGALLSGISMANLHCLR